VSCEKRFSDGVYSPANRISGRLGGIARNVDDGAIFVKRRAMAASGSTRNVLYFFGRQLAGAHTIQYSVRSILLQHDLLLFLMK
jgi:hypothetical protein